MTENPLKPKRTVSTAPNNFFVIQVPTPDSTHCTVLTSCYYGNLFKEHEAGKAIKANALFVVFRLLILNFVSFSECVLMYTQILPLNFMNFFNPFIQHVTSIDAFNDWLLKS